MPVVGRGISGRIIKIPFIRILTEGWSEPSLLRSGCQKPLALPALARAPPATLTFVTVPAGSEDALQAEPVTLS